MKIASRKRVFTLVIILAISLISVMFLYQNSLQDYAEKMEQIDVAYSPFESTALFWIAQNQHFFNLNGINVTSHLYNTGANALEAVLKGEADIVIGTNEFPLVGKAFSDTRVRTVASISKSEFIYLVGRKDRGIENVLDLKGKRVGTTFGTIAQFFLGRFIGLHGLSTQDIILIDLKTPEEWVNAIVDGEIDAVVTAQPYANLVRDHLGDNAVVWSTQSNQPLYTQVISTNEWITEHPDIVIQFLKALLKAEEYSINYPSEAKAIVKKQLNITDSYVETIWRQNQFSLSLDQSLLLAMEDEARWMIANNLTSSTTLPDFMKNIYIDGLQAVKPGAVSIIH